MEGGQVQTSNKQIESKAIPFIESMYSLLYTKNKLYFFTMLLQLNSRTLDSHTHNEDQERKQDNDPYWRQTSSLSLSEAIKQSRDLLQVKKV